VRRGPPDLRWFCRLGLDGEVPDRSTFSKTRHGRFCDADLLRQLFETVLRRCMAEGLVGGEGFKRQAIGTPITPKRGPYTVPIHTGASAQKQTYDSPPTGTIPQAASTCPEPAESSQCTSALACERYKNGRTRAQSISRWT
jgi:IS5 family transposase